MSYRVHLQCPPNFKKLIENGVKIEEAMVKKGELKLYMKDNGNSSNHNNSNNNNDRSKYWNKNKNVVNDGVVDNKNIKTTQPILNLGNMSTTPQASQVSQETQNQP